MNADHRHRQWPQLRPALKERWVKLTDEDLRAIDNDRVELINRLQHRYGFERDQVEQDVADFLNAV
jgi:uncharacterized protein YjbJ (UPF0337 family)